MSYLGEKFWDYPSNDSLVTLYIDFVMPDETRSEYDQKIVDAIIAIKKALKVKGDLKLNYWW